MFYDGCRSNSLMKALVEKTLLMLGMTSIQICSLSVTADAAWQCDSNHLKPPARNRLSMGRT